MQVRDVMTQQVACCTPDTDLQEVAKMMTECDCGAIPVIDRDSGKAIGIITDRDIVCRSIASGKNPIGRRVEEVMTMPIAAVIPDSTLDDCLAKMESAQIRRIPVVDERGRLCGIISQADIARAAGEHAAAMLLKDVSKPSEHASRLS